MREWAQRWGVPQAAIDELINMTTPLRPTVPGDSEAAVQQRVRLAASQQGARLFRNNVGVLYDDNNRPVRFGLANESPAINKRLKSSDLVGITPVTITHAHIGRQVGVFTSYECKRPGWQYTGKGREEAQHAWLLLVQSLGGIAKFVTGEDEL